MVHKKKIIFISLFLLALSVRSVYLTQTHHLYYYAGVTSMHGVIALNLFKGYGLLYSPIINSEVNVLQVKENRLVDLIQVKDSLSHQYSYHTAFEVPGYSYLLALTWKLFGEERYIYLQIIQIFIDSLLVFCIYYICSKLLNKKIGFIASIIFAFFPAEIFMSTLALRDIWMVYVTIVSVSLLLFSQSVTNSKLRYLLYFLISIIIGFGIYIHPIVELFNVSLGISIGIMRSWKHSLQFLLVSSFTIGLILLPWILKNYTQFSRIIPTRNVLWQGVWEGWGEFNDNPMGAILNDEVTRQNVIKEIGRSVDYGSIEYIDILKVKSIDAIKKYPLWVLGAVIRRGLVVLDPIPLPAISLDQNYRLSNSYIIQKSYIFSVSFLNAIYFSYHKYKFIFYFFILLGFFSTLHTWKKNSILYLVFLYYVILISLIHVEKRYELVIYNIYIIFAACGTYTMSIFLKNIYINLRSYYIKENKF